MDTYMYGSGEGNIKMDLIEMIYEDMDGIQIADSGVQKPVFWVTFSFWKKKTGPPVQVTEAVKHVTFMWIFLDTCKAYWGVYFSSRQAEEYYLKFSSTPSFQIISKSSFTSHLSFNVV